jgi:hypothetical protein
LEFVMSVDFTAFDAQLTGTNGAAGSAGGTIDGGDGGNAIESLPPFSNTDFSLEPSLARVFPTATAGNGGAGAGGANATATTLALQGGAGGKGGAAFITMDHDIFGSAATPYIGFVTITMSVDAATIGSAGGDSGGVGGAGGRGGLGITVVTGVNGSQDSRGSDGAIGGVGGFGEVANADLTAMTSYATSDLQIQLISNGGKGGQGGFGGSGGNGSLSAGNGADGAKAGAGALAEATFSGATAFNDSAIFVTEKPTGGFGGSGGNGGNGGNLGPVGSPPTGFGANGNGGAGGAGGGASATVSGDTLTAPSVQFTLNADGGQGGAGGSGGNAGPAHGLNGAAGSDGAGSITFTNNVITVGSGVPGDTQLSGNDLLLLNLRVATIGPAGFFLPGTLNGGVGGNLTFSGNTFLGDGQSRLVLQLGSTGTAVVDTASNTMTIDGSPTTNTISGFTTFDLDTNDTFVAGGGSYRVTFAPDPDTLVMTPTSGNVTLSGITATNFLLDFRGFGPSFDAAALAADTNTSTGSTVITLSPTSVITLQGYTGGIASGAVIFEPPTAINHAPIVTPQTASVGEDGPSFSSDLLIGASDPDLGTVLTIQKLDTSVTTADGRTLALGTDYVLNGSTLAMTAAGFAKFNNLSGAQTDQMAFHFSVSDGTAATPDTLTLTISSANDAPTVTPQVASVGEHGPSFSSDLLIGASDPDLGTVLTIQNLDASVTTADGRTLPLGTDYILNGSTLAMTAAGFAEFNGLSGSQSDQAVFHFGVSDGIVATSDTLTLDIIGANDAPVLASQTAGQSTIAGTPFSLILPANTFQDPDSGDLLTLAATASNGAALPAWLSFNPTTGALSGTAGPGDVGAFDVTVTATDTGGLTATDTFHFSVTAPGADHPPVITSDGGGDAASIIITDDSKYVATIHAVDPDPGTVLAYSIVGGADQKLFAIDANTGVLAFKSTPRDGHSYHVTVAASDGSLKGTQSITVHAANGPREFGTPGIADTFVFKPHFGLAVVNNFDATSPVHDVLELNHALFHNADANAPPAAILNLVEAHSYQLGRDVIIVTDTHDIIDLRNTSLHSLTAHDFILT